MISSVYTFINSIISIATLKIRFIREDIGKAVQMHDGYKFTVFRHAVNSSKPKKGRDPVVLCVRFHPAKENSVRSNLTMLHVVGAPGFREKYWMINRWNGDFQGLYEWDREKYAKEYVDSFVMKFLKQRSVPGSLQYEIIPRIGLKDHMRHLGL